MESASILKIAPLMEDIPALLAKLTRHEWYLPALSSFIESRQREWLAVRVLLKEILGEEKQVLYTPSGRPYLADHSHSISFSHTQGFIAVIVGSEANQQVAVDIEMISPQVQRVRKKFMSEEEERHLDLSQENVHLLLHWSAKESLYKLLDNDRISLKRDLRILPFVPASSGSGTFRATFPDSSGKEQTVTLHYRIAEEYVLTWGSES